MRAVVAVGFPGNGVTIAAEKRAVRNCMLISMWLQMFSHTTVRTNTTIGTPGWFDIDGQTGKESCLHVDAT